MHAKSEHASVNGYTYISVSDVLLLRDGHSSKLKQTIKDRREEKIPQTKVSKGKEIVGWSHTKKTDSC